MEGTAFKIFKSLVKFFGFRIEQTSRINVNFLAFFEKTIQIHIFNAPNRKNKNHIPEKKRIKKRNKKTRIFGIFFSKLLIHLTLSN